MTFDPSSLRQTWPAPSRPMPIVTIGAGSIVVDAHFPAYRKGGFPIAGVFDLNAERAKMVGEKFGVRVFGSLDEALGPERRDLRSRDAAGRASLGARARAGRRRAS